MSPINPVVVVVGVCGSLGRRTPHTVPLHVSFSSAARTGLGLRDTKTAISCCRMQERRLLTWAERNSSLSIGLGVSSGLVGMWCEYSQDGSCGRKLTQREVQASLRFGSASRVGVSKRVVSGIIMSDTVDLLTDKEIADSFQAEGGIWSHVRATDRKPGLLRLFLDSSDVKADIEKQVWKVPRILGVSARCKGLSDHYLVVAVRFAFRQATLLKPNDHIVDWSHHNRVSIAQAYWRHAQLILSMASKEDALTLCSKPSVFLDGQEGEVEYARQSMSYLREELS